MHSEHLHDSLTRLFSLRDASFSYHTVKYFVSDPWRIRDFPDHLSALAGYKVRQEQIVDVSKVGCLSVQKLYHPLPPSTPTTHTKDSYKWLLDAYLDYFSVSSISCEQKLWLSRNSVRSGSRQVVNEEEILSYLLPLGFTVVYGDEPLPDIVRAFASAKIVMGAHGSLFVNAIYCQESCRIVEFCPANRVDRSLQVKHKRAIDYDQVTIPADSSFNISIPLSSIAGYLES